MDALGSLLAVRVPGGFRPDQTPTAHVIVVLPVTVWVSFVKSHIFVHFVAIALARACVRDGASVL